MRSATPVPPAPSAPATWHNPSACSPVRAPPTPSTTWRYELFCISADAGLSLKYVWKIVSASARACSGFMPGFSRPTISNHGEFVSASIAAPFMLFNPYESRIDRALVEIQCFLRDLLEPAGDAVGMMRPHGDKGAEDQEVESALQDLDGPLYFT